jgi:hypothetical protein
VTVVVPIPTRFVAVAPSTSTNPSRVYVESVTVSVCPVSVRVALIVVGVTSIVSGKVSPAARVGHVAEPSTAIVLPLSRQISTDPFDLYQM